MKKFAILRLSSKILSCSIRRIFASPCACSLQKFGLEVDQNGLELYFVSCFSKIYFLQRFFSLRTKLFCFLYLTTSFSDLDFKALIFNREHFIISEYSVLLTWGLWLPRRIFPFGTYLSKTSTELFLNVLYSYELLESGSLY